MITPPNTFRQNLMVTVAVVSMIGSALSLVFWIHSMWETATLSLPLTSRTSFFISSHKERIEFAVQHAPLGPRSTVGTRVFIGPVDVSRLGGVGGTPALGSGNGPGTQWLPFDAHTLQHGRFGFGFTSIHVIRMFAIPHWFAMLLTAGLGYLCWQASKAPSRLLRRHLCHICGYDLRATRDQCPECGTVVPGRSPTFLKQITPYLTGNENQKI